MHIRVQALQKMYWKICKCAQASINKFIQVIFTNIITYLDRTFLEEQSDIDHKMK